MPYVYALKSRKTGKLYVGWTAKNPEERLLKHEAGGSEWTRRNGPFDIVFSEILKTDDLARKRERFFKSGKGRTVLKTLLNIQRPCPAGEGR